VPGQGAGKETGAPASFPAAAPPRPPQPQRSHRTGRRNRANISRERVRKIPGFIRQADVRADSFIPMRTIPGICVGLCPSSRTSAMPLGETLTPLPSSMGAGLGVSWQNDLPAPHFHPWIPRALVRKLRNSWAGDDSLLGLTATWIHGTESISVSASPRADTEPNQHASQGAENSPSFRPPLPSIWKKNPNVRYRGEGKVLAVTEEPHPGHWHQGFAQGVWVLKGEKGRTGGNGCWRIKRKKRETEKGWGERWEQPESRAMVPSGSKP